MQLLPQARNTGVVVQELGKELLIYDLTTHDAYQLNEALMIVFKACDGQQSFAHLKREYRMTDDLIYLALDELKKNRLLAEQTDYVSPLAGLSRREAIKRVGLATMIALPVILGITAPAAAQAASLRGTLTNGRRCTTLAAGTSQECASGYCVTVSSLSFPGNTCCTQSSSSGGRPPVYGYFLVGMNLDSAGCAAAATRGCCTGRGSLSGGSCYCD